jgi:hypothetical protein
MKSIFVMYMPGHAGHMIARLFGLSPETMPLTNKNLLNVFLRTGTGIKPTTDRLKLYQFKNVKDIFASWQEFHRSFADHKDSTNLRLINAFGGHTYTSIVYPIHPHEFHHDFQEIDETECYYVDLDLELWGSWVDQQQKELKFVCRPQEQEYFERYKILYNMKPISLTKLLGTVQEFEEEYLKITNSMNITPVLDQATVLFNEWKSIRVSQ